MAKKDFKNAAARRFISTAEQTPQDVHAPQDPQEVISTPSVLEKPMTRQTVSPSQGKRGQKFPRINMAFSPQNLEYLNLIGRVEGVSATEYVNRLVGKDMETRQETIETARKLFKEVGK